MIVDLQAFASREQPLWDELDRMLDRIEEQGGRLDLETARRLHYLYERTSADLLALDGAAAAPDLHRNLEALISRAYGEIHSSRRQALRFAPRRWFLTTFPRTFRRHARLFAAAALITLAGSTIGGFAVRLDPLAKPVVLPFAHLLGDPSRRVAEEEEHSLKERGGRQSFSALLMANNIRVSINAVALGVTWGIGTGVLLFYNGAILGAVCTDYAAAGEGAFLAGWLLPHGAIEIPSILIAGQAGLLLGLTVLGRRRRERLADRLRQIVPDLVTLIGGCSVLLVWAALVESFLSQYHAPRLYPLKIAFGIVQLSLLSWLLGCSGRRRGGEEP